MNSIECFKTRAEFDAKYPDYTYSDTNSKFQQIKCYDKNHNHFHSSFMESNGPFQHCFVFCPELKIYWGAIYETFPMG